MSTDAAAPNDEISYVRELAERGAHAPLLGGRFMVWWGLLLGIAYVAHHFALAGRIGDDRSIFAFIWGGFSLLGIAGQLALARTMPAKAGAGSAGNRASRSVWFAATSAIGAMVVGTVAAARTGAGPATFDWIVPVAFAVYACALIVTGTLARSRVTTLAGVGAVMMVALFTALILNSDRYLFAAAGVVMTVLLPGLLLLMAEPQAQE